MKSSARGETRRRRRRDNLTSNLASNPDSDRNPKTHRLHKCSLVLLSCCSRKVRGKGSAIYILFKTQRCTLTYKRESDRISVVRFVLAP